MPARVDTADISVALRPTTRLTLQTKYLLTRLSEPDGETVFRNHIARARVNYQFTRALSVRAILQTDTLKANPAASALQPMDRLNIDVMIMFHQNYGTALYAGFNTDLHGGPPLATEQPRQFFVKYSRLVAF